MKKILLVLFAMLSSISFVSFSHAEVLQQSSQSIELKDEVSKDFILRTLDPWISYDSHKYYRQHYGAKESTGIGSSPENITVWLEKVKLIPDDGKYTHIVRIQRRNINVLIDGKKNFKAVDILTYAVDANELTSYSDKEKIIRSVKLLDFTHKEIANK